MNADPPLKVLHFITTVGGGGAETMLCNAVEEMTRNGVENIVVSTTSSSDEFSLRPRIERSARFFDLQVNSLLAPAMWRQFWVILREERPDVVQTWMHTSGLVAGALARLAGVRNVVWGVHSRDLLEQFGRSDAKVRVLRKILGIAARIIPRRIISCSQDGLENHVRRLWYPRRKMLCIGNGIDVERFRPNPAARAKMREKLGIPADAPVFGIVARPNPVKDVPTFLRAAALAQNRHPDAHFAVAGLVAGEIEPQIEVPDLRRLHWLGYQPEMAEIYPIFDVLTLTSLSEAYPMVLIEAMACGVPCVTTDVGDARVMVGETGRIFPMRDPEALVEVWGELVRLTGGELEELRTRARTRAVADFSVKTCVGRYEALYRELASGIAAGRDRNSEKVWKPI